MFKFVTIYLRHHTMEIAATAGRSSWLAAANFFLGGIDFGFKLVRCLAICC